MNTITTTASTNTPILAIDLDKYKGVPVFTTRPRANFVSQHSRQLGPS